MQDLRQALEGLLGPCHLEIVPEEGPLALARLRAQRPRLSFLSMDMRFMDGLTLLRALPHRAQDKRFSLSRTHSRDIEADGRGSLSERGIFW